MKINLELLASHIAKTLVSSAELLTLDPNEIIETVATRALSEIKAVIKNSGLSDFEAIEEITAIFQKYNIDFGSRHDF